MSKRFVVFTLMACVLVSIPITWVTQQLTNKPKDIEPSPIVLIAESDDGYVGVYEYCDAKLDKYTIISGGWIYVEKEVGGCITLKDSH